MDKIDQASIDELVRDGLGIYEDKKANPKIKKMVETILDEKYGTQAGASGEGEGGEGE